MIPVIPELRLLLACARGEAAPREIHAALEGPLDWALTLRLAEWHGLRPLLHRHLSAIAPARVPRPVMVELWAAAEAIARANRAAAAELARIAEHFEARAIRFLAYKGPLLALDAYGDVALREFFDLDLLVPVADLRAAKAALVERGYRPEPLLTPAAEEALIAARPRYNLGLRSPAGLLVELHWKSDADFPVEGSGAAWWDAAARTRVGTVAARVFTPEELLLVLCIHGAKHRWESLGWLVDVAELLRRGPALDWDAIARRARGLRCARRVGAGLALARDLLGADLPHGARACVDTGAEALAGRLGPSILAAAPEIPPQLQALRLSLAMHESVRLRVRHALETVFHPTLAEWLRWPLPRSLFGLYPALRVWRLAAKYGRRALGRLTARGKLQV